jgi:hypothetical protein
LWPSLTLVSIIIIEVSSSLILHCHHHRCCPLY